MSADPRPHSFLSDPSKFVAIDETDHRLPIDQRTLAVLHRLIEKRPHVIRDALARPGDIEARKAHISAACDNYRDYILILIDELNENLPMDRVIDMQELRDGFDGIKESLVFALEHAGDRDRM